MRKTLFVSLSLLLFLMGQQAVKAQRLDDTISLSVTSGQKVITRNLGQGLVLRVVKESSVRQEHFGWRLEVVRRPYRPTSNNLLYQNRAGHGADPSQVYAWHVSERHFPNKRVLRVRGYPYTVRVELVNCTVEGKGPEAGFVSGEMRVSWARRR